MTGWTPGLPEIAPGGANSSRWYSGIIMATHEDFRHRIPATKLRPPSTAVRHLPRPRLSIGPANEGPFRLALVSAPAGCGKTTVLTEWHRSLTRPHASTAPAWLSLDGFDNDPRRFLAGLIAAVRQARPSFGGEALRVLAANPDALTEDVVTSLARDFGKPGVRITVFLDDYHEIRDRAVHAALDYLLAHLPAGCRFVLGTRSDPPLSVERLRTRGEVLEIRWEALRFRVDEARRYLKEVCRLRLTEGQVRALCDRTEGWIAGLQLAAMAFTAGADGERFVASITGEQRAIAGYLLEGVFARQPADVREFLVRTSILDRLTAPLCDALTGRRDGRRMLEALESGNLFLFGLDDRRAWYRYHQLFAGFLRDRLRAAHPDEVAALHDRASEWFERNGSPREAAQYAIAGSRFDRAARLLETAGRDLFRQGDFKELRRWIDALPDRTVRRSPVLCALHAWALGYLGEFDAARRRIACAESASAAPPGRGSRAVRPACAPAAQGAIRAELQVIRAVLGIIQADEPDVSGLHPGIVSLFPRDEAALRAYASITLGFVSRVGGYLPLALQHFQEALVVSDGANSSLVNLNARRNIGIVNYMMGRLNDAEASFRGSLEVARERLWLRSIGAAFLRHGLALVLHERNGLKGALEELSDAIAFLEASDAYGFLGMVLLERARNQIALGKAALAAADLARARDVARRHDVRRVSFRADLLDAQAALRAGDADRAAAFLGAAGESFAGEDLRVRPVLSEKHACLAMEQLRLLLAREQFGEAVRLAARAVQGAGATGRGRDLVEFLVLQASAWSGLGQADKALAKVGQAASLAAPEGIIRPFADAGHGVAALLRRLEDGGGAAAGTILSGLADGGEAVCGGAAAAPAEKLHCRETQILALISQGLRNREIGERLFLSEETVKWYLKRLFCKLDVRTRTQAIASARKLRLLS